MDGKKLKIVVISENESDANYFTHTISEALPGTEVHIAPDGLQGVKTARKVEPDVILIDISITNKESIKISRMIKKDVALQLTPMLFITDLEADRKFRNRAILAGAEAFLIRPIDDAILITQLISMAKIKERNILIKKQKKQLEALVEIKTNDLKKEVAVKKEMEGELRRSEEIFKTYIEKAPIGIFVVNAKGEYVDANEMACQLMGRTKEEVLHASISDYLVPDHLDRGLADFRELSKKGFMESEYKVRNKDKHEYWISFRGAKIDDNCYIAFCSDISERKEKEARVEYLSYHDSLTGAYNRAFYEQETERLETIDNLPCSVIICDINGLKLINDSLGHAAGDKILVQTTRLLEKFLRRGDILARIGGDEFSVSLPRTNNREARDMVDRIRTECLETKVKIFKSRMPLSISLGYSTKTTMTDSFSYISKLAEDDMYRRKLLEREGFHSAVLETLRVSLFERSHETEEHAARMVDLSQKLGEAMHLSKDELNDLELLSALHDIGKINIDNSILMKPGKLTDAEWIEMKKHPAIGYRIAMASTELRSIAEYILCHHERWDGKGYPQGINGEGIPLLSRVISVVDAYDAMTNDRPYHKAMSRDDAIEEITKNSGSQFDPQIAAMFLSEVV